MQPSILLLFILVSSSTPSPLFNLIGNYLTATKTSLCYFFTCWSKYEIAEMGRILDGFHIRYKFIVTPTTIGEELKDANITRYGYFLQFSCTNFSNILTKETKSVNFRQTRPWIIFGNTANLAYWANFFLETKLRLDSNIILIIPDNLNKYNLYEIYNLGRNLGGSTLINRIGYWNGIKLVRNHNNFYLQRRNMSGITLRATGVVLVRKHEGTFQEYIFDTRYKHHDTQSKFHYPIFLYLKDMHNFNFNLTITNKWYGNTTSGIDGGVARLLHEDLADICCTGGAQRYSRIDVLDYLAPSYHFRPCYIFRNPGSYDPLKNEFLKPFSDKLWLVLLASIGCTCVLFKSFNIIENRILGNTSRYCWSSVILLTIGTILQQSSSFYPSRIAGRFLYLSLLIMSLLIYNYYTTSILSSLLNDTPSVISTLSELGHSGLEIGIENLPYTITWFLITNTSDVQHIYKKKVTLPDGSLNILPPIEGIAKVRNGGFAYYTQLDTGYPIIERTYNQDEICDLAKIPMLPQSYSGLIVQKKSQFYELFQISSRLIQQSGLIQRLSLIWESKPPRCMSNSLLIPVGIDQSFIAFFTLFIGMLLSLAILIVEIVWFRKGFDGGRGWQV